MRTVARTLAAFRPWRVATRRKSFRRPNIRSMAFRSRQGKGEKRLFHSRLALGGMSGAALRRSTCLRIAFASWPLSACGMSPFGSCSRSAAPVARSATWPPVGVKASGLRYASVRVWISVVRPPSDAPSRRCNRWGPRRAGLQPERASRTGCPPADATIVRRFPRPIFARGVNPASARSQ